MHIGLIGGIGPAATVAYYKQLICKFEKAGLPLELTIVHADVGDLIANAASDRRGAQAEIFARHLRQLKGAGCDVATITALTGHFCFEETKLLSDLPMFSAIGPIDHYCTDQGITTIGILGSPPVMASHLFGQLHHTSSVIPRSDTDGLGEAYLNMASTGICSDAARKLFFEEGAEMVADQGADAVLLAGTDLGLAFDGHDPGFRVIDALKIHVNALVAQATEKTE